MGNTYRENCSTIVITTGIQIKTIIRCIDMPINIAKIKRLTFPSAYKDMEHLEFYTLLVTNHSILEESPLSSWSGTEMGSWERNLWKLLRLWVSWPIPRSVEPAVGEGEQSAVQGREREAGTHQTHTMQLLMKISESFFRTVLLFFLPSCSRSWANSNPAPYRKSFLGNIAPSLIKLTVQLFNNFYNKKLSISRQKDERHFHRFKNPDFEIQQS